MANLEETFLVAVELVIQTGPCCFIRGALPICAIGSPRFHYTCFGKPHVGRPRASSVSTVAGFASRKNAVRSRTSPVPQSGAQEAWQGSTGSPQGNTTFIAQPKTSAIDKVLPPPMSAVGDTLQVIFSARKHSHFRCQELCIYNARSCGEIGVLCIKMSQWMCSEPKRLFGMMKLLRKFSGSA